jgi:tRNA(Ile)-lysidine synthase
MPPRNRQPRHSDAFAAALTAVLEQWALEYAPSRITVAFSGGLDSTVLLAALARLELPAPLRAAHVDHGLHPRSHEWSEHCARVAAALGVELRVLPVAVERSAPAGLEAAAREARYGALGELLSPGEWLLTAHHADDQLETLLLRLLRGTGVRGLAGIADFAPFAGGRLGRPLLKFTRARLRAEAEARGLEWLEDPSNWDPRHDRNYLRLYVLPALTARWPAAAPNAVRLAAQARDAERLLESLADADAAALAAPWHVPREVLEALEPARQRNLLRRQLRAVGSDVPGAAKLEELRRALLAAHAESHARVSWPGGEGRVYRGALYLLRPLPPASPRGYEARLGLGTAWTGPEGRVELVPADGAEGLPQSWADEGLRLRFRAGGERFRPRGHAHRRSLKQLFQEAGVVPWMRERVPLVYRGGELVAVGDLWLGASVDEAQAGEPRWRVRWSEHPPVRAPQRR